MTAPEPTPSAAAWLRRTLPVLLGVATAGAAAGAAPEGDAASAAARRPAMSASNPATPRPARKTFAVAQLEPLLPERLGAWQRSGLEAPRRGAIHGPGPVLRAEYEREALAATLSIADPGPPSAALAELKGGAIDRPTDTGREAVYKSGRRLVRETFERSTNASSVSVTLGNGLVVVALSQSADTLALRGLIDAMDLTQAEALARPKR